MRNQNINARRSFRAFPQFCLLRGSETGHYQRLGRADNLLGQRRNIRLLAGRKNENSVHGSGTWKVTSTGLEIHSETFGGIFQVEMRDDGTILDATYNIAGKVCK